MDEIPLATVAGPPPTPAATALAAPSDLREEEHSGDWRVLLHLAILLGVGVHAVRLGNDLAPVLRLSERLMLFVQDVLSRGGTGNMGNVAALVVLLAMAAAILLAPCAMLWIVWGILSLNYGAGARRAVWWLTVVTLVLAVLCVLPGWVYGIKESGIEFGMLSRAPEIVHAVFLAALLTRPGVMRLFARGSETDDSR